VVCSWWCFGWWWQPIDWVIRRLDLVDLPGHTSAWPDRAVTLLSEGVVALIVGGKVAALITQSAALFFGRQRRIAASALIEQ